MNLSKVLWQNWLEWSDGGLPESKLKEDLTESEAAIISAWIDQAYSMTDSTRSAIDIKSAVDIASWCLYGTHSLLIKPRGVRIKEIVSTAESIGIPEKVLQYLIAKLPDLEKCLK